MSLSEQDRELVAGFDGLLGPRHRERAVAAVELIVARQVAAALSEAADEWFIDRVEAVLEDDWHQDQCACDDWPRGCASSLKGREPFVWDVTAVLNAARIVRSRP